jgi:hypothetical protein
MSTRKSKQNASAIAKQPAGKPLSLAQKRVAAFHAAAKHKLDKPA